MKQFAAVLLLSTLSLCALAADAPAPAADPADAVPDAMPFNIPYGAPITLEQANKLLAVGVAEARRHNWNLNMAVVDSGGNLVAFSRMDGAQLASIAISEHKAKAAATYRRETKLFEKGVNIGHVTSILSLDGVVASRGGVPVVVDGKLIGAVGCSGGTGSQDEVVCKAMTDSLK